jgi:anti-sigma-K factor RskA
MTDYFADVGAYLLGALSPGETEAFERELEGNAQLRADVEHLRVAAEALPASPVQLEPPGALKDRIMAVVNSEAELLAAAGPEADRSPKRPVRRPGRWWSMRPGLAVAASALVLVCGGIGVLLSGGSDSHTVTAVTGHARLIERASGHSTLTATGLPSPGSGHVYQVWLQRGRHAPRPTNALFGVRRDGTASVDVPGSLAHVDTVLVTSEPEGGSRAPTTKPVIVAHPT